MTETKAISDNLVDLSYQEPIQNLLNQLEETLNSIKMIQNLSQNTNII